MKQTLYITFFLILAQVVNAQSVINKVHKEEIFSKNSDTKIYRTVLTINGIDIYGSDSKDVFVKGRNISWRDSDSRFVSVPLHREEFDMERFLFETGHVEEDIVYTRFVYFKENDEYIPAIHVQTFDGEFTKTYVVHQDSYRVLKEILEVDNCFHIHDTQPIKEQFIPRAVFQYWHDDSPAPGTPHLTGIPDGWQAEEVIPRYIHNQATLPSPIGWLDIRTPHLTKGNNAVSVTYGIENEFFGDGFVRSNMFIDQTLFFVPRYSFTKELQESETLQASAVNMFVHANQIHDWLWHHGFQESDGNFQEYNFGRGGIEGDAMSLNAQYSTFAYNNAYYTGTYIDGTPGLITMLSFRRGEDNPERHSGFDSQIFTHEYQHGVTRRLVGPITDRYARALNEGWSDLVGLIRTYDEPKDPYADVVAMGGWTLHRSLNNILYVDNYYFGGRMFPVTWDMSKNPMTLADIDPLQFHVEPGIPYREMGMMSPHYVGQIWVAAIWDIYMQLISVYGIEEARVMIIDLIIEGLKITPPEPTIEVARDSFILADESLFGGEHRVALWNAFSRRGIGPNATVDLSFSVGNVTEDMNKPNWGDYDQDGDTDGMDVMAFLADYSENNRRSDLNWDGIFDKSDVQIFMDLFNGNP